MSSFKNNVTCKLFLHQLYWLIGLESGVFANSSGDQGSIPGRFIPKTLNGT